MNLYWNEMYLYRYTFYLIYLILYKYNSLLKNFITTYHIIDIFLY